MEWIVLWLLGCVVFVWVGYRWRCVQTDPAYKEEMRKQLDKILGEPCDNITASSSKGESIHDSPTCNVEEKPSFQKQHKDAIVFMHQFGECCACRQPMQKSFHINFAVTGYRASWNVPVGFHQLITGVTRRAVAIICDECVKSVRPYKVAIECALEERRLLYHPLETLHKIDQEDMICSRN